MLNFVKNFFCIYWDDHMVFILQFIDVVHHVDLCILKNSCIPEISPLDHGVWSFKHIVGFDLLVFDLLRIFASMFICDIFGFGIRVTLVFRMTLEVLLPLQCSVIIWKGEELTLLEMFGRINLWSHLVLDFCLLGVLKLLIQFHYCHWSIYIFYFFLVQSWEIVPF